VILWIFVYICGVMKILLLGEYSRLHNSLKEGLQALGHRVTLVGTGDDFKAFPSDIDVSSTLRNRFLPKVFWMTVFKFSGFDYFKKDIYHRLKKIASSLKDYDVVQLINEDAFAVYPEDEMRFYQRIFRQNKAVFLSACGEDTHVIRYYKDGGMRYSILNPFEEIDALEKEAAFSYKYLKPEYEKLHDFVLGQVQAVIPSDLDYAIPYAKHPKVVPMIPNPVNVDKIQFKPVKISNKINIFFGINRLSFYKKGSHIVLRVLKKIEETFSDRVKVVYAENMPYSQYIRLYDEAHILIDQLYSYDQGFNALEAMAAGKCVITGAEKEFYEYYDLDKPVAVNSLPDEHDLYQKLVNLIEHKEKIEEIGKNARIFVEQHHHYVRVAEQYLETWQKFI